MGRPDDESLHQNIHQHYLNSASPSAVNIAYAFGNADKLNDSDITHRHAIIQLHDPKKGLSGRGPGHVIPTGMEGIGSYDIIWPTKADPRWKPTGWIEKEAATNILTEHKGDGICRVDRNHPDYKVAPEPTRPYKTTGSGSHLAPVGMGALAHLIGNEDKQSWEDLGHHAANTCVNRPGNAFDGHASANLAAFWSILGAARSDDPEKLRAYLNYMKTFLILTALAELSHASELKPLPMALSKAHSPVWLARVGSDRKLTFQAMTSDKQASFEFSDLTATDHALLARLVARHRPDNPEAQATAGIYVELTGDTVTADEYFEKAGTEVREKLDALFE